MGPDVVAMEGVVVDCPIHPFLLESMTSSRADDELLSPRGPDILSDLTLAAERESRPLPHCSLPTLDTNFCTISGAAASISCSSAPLSELLAPGKLAPCARD